MDSRNPVVDGQGMNYGNDSGPEVRNHQFNPFSIWWLRTRMLCQVYFEKG